MMIGTSFGGTIGGGLSISSSLCGITLEVGPVSCLLSLIALGGAMIIGFDTLGTGSSDLS